MSNIIYANGRVSTKINSLVGTERLNRMIETDSPEDAFKILSETGFGGDLSAGVVCFEKSLSYELAQLDSFIRDVCPSENLKRFLLYKNDFHNAEALIKCKFLKTDEKSLLVQDGVFRAAEMKERIFSDDYKYFPLNMALAFAECDEKFVSGSADGVFVNNAIEKAYFADLYETAKKQPLLLKLYKVKADCANIQIALRCRDYNAAEKFFVKNGVICDDDLKVLCVETFDVIREKFRFSEYKEILGLAVDAAERGKPFSEFEKAADDFPLKILLEKKYSSEGYLPFATYCYYKLAEIKNVRIILVGLLNGESKTAIKNRLRLTYEG
ncbi:MAG: V-type ATPase subunit [Candidatus Borkfalkiaceae bacterium]|nr:V-type ATPase subunit [Christensenellaceae bacterium]